VDLAGSERVKKTDTEGAGLEEAKFINRSLTYLEQCVVAACDKNRDHIPFRQTRLTNILRDSIGGNCATLLMANIWGEKVHLEETLSTCRFAQRMMRVQNIPSANVHQDPNLLIKKQEREIKQLKQELLMRDTLKGTSGVVYDEYTDEQRAALKTEVEEYLEYKKEDIELVNFRQMREILGVTRHIFKEMKTKTEDELRRQYDLKEKTAAGTADEIQRREAGDAGDVEAGASGFSVGKAPEGSAPPVSPTIGSPAGTAADEDGLPAADYGEDEALQETKVVQPRKRIPRVEAYEVFKAEEGSELNQVVVDDAKAVIDAKRHVKALGDRVNNDKYEMDRLKDLIARKANERAADEGGEDTVVIDEEEYAAMTELKKRKLSYREAFEKLRAAKHKVNDLTASIQSNKERLLEDFDLWYVTTYGPEPKEKVKQENSGPVYGPNGDMLDPDEAFEKLEVERIMEKDPKSFAFTQAAKHKHEMRGTLAAGRSQGAAMRARNRA